MCLSSLFWDIFRRACSVPLFELVGDQICQWIEQPEFYILHTFLLVNSLTLQENHTVRQAGDKSDWSLSLRQQWKHQLVEAAAGEPMKKNNEGGS
jgi:hypothetical protein